MLEHLPFTTKDQLRQGQEEAPPGRPLGLQQAVPQEYVVQVVASSGTTGRPVLSGLTRRDQEIWGDAIATGFWTAGIRPDDVIAHLVNLPLHANGWPHADGLRRLGATVAWFGGHPPERALSWLSQLQVTAVVTTTSLGVDLAEQAIACGKTAGAGVRKLLGGGEPGLGQPQLRLRVADGWGTSHVRDTMGLADVMANMWAECDDASGMHFCGARYVIVELVDPGTGARLPWADGARGEAVYTTFDRDATPVLRYRSADHLEVTGTRCACGRTSPKVRCLGRADDMLVYRTMNVYPSAIRDVVLRRFGDVLGPHLRIWKDAAEQVRHDDPIPVELEARTGVGSDRWQTLVRRVGEAVREELSVQVAPMLLPPGALPRSADRSALVQVRLDTEPDGGRACAPD
jgi:phenylacetate-CoA ligase/benzoylacetate-CoA ligase